MPYELQSAYVRPKGLGEDWLEVDISSLDINLIHYRFSQIVLRLKHTAAADSVYLNFNQARAIVGLYTGHQTIPQWLERNGNATLPTMADFNPEMKGYPMLYSDAVAAGYQIRRFDRRYHVDTDLAESDKRDLLLSKPDIDYSTWHRYLLATVNGFVHRIIPHEEGFVVIDGARTVDIGNDYQIGLLSFREVGALDVIPITESMLYKNDEQRQRYSEYVNIKLPMDLTNKTPLLVVGGYLHILDSSYRQTGERTLKVKMHNLRYHDRFFDSLGQIDLRRLGLESARRNEYQFSTLELFSDEVIKRYLTLNQSFVVLLDTTNVYLKTHRAELTNFVGRYLTQNDMPRLPLRGNLGRLLEYRSWPTKHCKVIATKPHYNFERMSATTDHTNHSLSIDNANYSARPAWNAQADFIEFGRIG